MRVRRHFSNNLDKHDNKLIVLYDDGVVLSFPGFGIIMIIDFFPFSRIVAESYDTIEDLTNNLNGRTWKFN